MQQSRELPIEPNCKAFFVGGNFNGYIHGILIESFRVPAQEVTVIGDIYKLMKISSIECANCKSTTAITWKIQPKSHSKSICTCECTLIRLDGGDFKNKEEQKDESDLQSVYA